MKTVLCDCAGCNRPAGWVRATEGTTPTPDFLCQVCWERMEQTHPDQASDYVVYHIYSTPSRRAHPSNGGTVRG